MKSGFLVAGEVGPVALASVGLADPVPVAGAELLTNGDMELDDASWRFLVSPTTNERSADFAVSGTYSRKIVGDAIDEGILQSRTAVSGWHILEARVRPTAAMSLWLMVRDGTGYLQSFYSTVAANAWTNFAYSGRWTNLIVVYVRSRLLNQPWYVDDVTLKPLTLSSLLSTRAYASADCDISAAVTRTAGTQAGLCARLDSATSPANFVIAYETGAGRVRVDKCVGGTYTNIIDGAVTYVAGQVLRLVCSGNDVSVYYNGTQVGSTTAVADAGIVSNVRHGKFSTYAVNKLNGFQSV